MTSISFFDFLVFVSGLTILAATLTRLMLGANILAVPNQRSSHRHPIPSSGGIGIVATVYAGVMAAYVAGPYFQRIEPQLLGLGLATLVVATAGFLDDLGRIEGFRSKLAAQLCGCGILLASDIVISAIPLPFLGSVMLGGWGYLVTAIWVIGVTNAYNFMDGLDGLATGTAVIVAATFGVISFMQGALFSHVMCFALFAASFGMFLFNFPRARIFMGDVGSQFVGFSLAAMAVLAAEFDSSSTPIFVMPLLLFNFLFDTVLTFIRRLFAGEDVTQAHRSHLYQLMNQLGYSHAQVSLFHFAVTLCQAGASIAVINGTVAEPALVFLPFLLFQCIYAAVVLRAARRRVRA